ncbi:MAG TPA: outer membrane beta-barrel domain-containing protein [Myxococcales bacterium]|nr:outer membrane beta-barrel domain-containing protein [Myxococcales bacterium]
MTPVLAALLLAAAQASGPAEKPQPEATKVAQVTPAALPPQAVLPPIASAPQYGAPASLPPVTAQLFHLGGMLEIQPLFAFSIGDPFWRTVGMGVRVEHHFDERWSLAGHAIGGLSLLSAPVQVCGDVCNDPSAGKLRSTPGKLQVLAGAELGWAPVYGKLSLVGERTLHFDFYVSAGPEIVREMIAPDAASAEQGRWAPGGRFTLGERLFFSNTFMVRIAASELVYSGRVRGRGEIERKLTIEGGLAWLFGGR